MVKMDILVASIVLLFREREGTQEEVDSSELVKSILNISKPKKKEFAYDGEIGDVNSEIIDFINKMIQEPEAYNDLTTLLGELKIIFRNNEVYYDSIKDQLSAEMTDGGKKRSMATLRNKLHKYYNEMIIIQVCSRRPYGYSS